MFAEEEVCEIAHVACHWARGAFSHQLGLSKSCNMLLSYYLITNLETESEKDIMHNNGINFT